MTCPDCGSQAIPHHQRVETFGPAEMQAHGLDLSWYSCPRCLTRFFTAAQREDAWRQWKRYFDIDADLPLRSVAEQFHLDISRTVPPASS